MNQELILATASAQKLALLKEINIVPTNVVSVNIDYSPLPKERAFALVKRLSLNKLNIAQIKYNNHFIVATATVINRGNLIIGKPKDPDEARSFLKLLSGRKHKVITGVCVSNPSGKTVSKIVSTTVSFKNLDITEINNYLKTYEWLNNNGGYTITGYAEMFVKQIIGSYSNILGLPTLITCNLLKGLGYIHKWP